MEHRNPSPPAQAPTVEPKVLRLGIDVQLRIEAVPDPSAPSGMALDVRLHRRRTEDVGEDDFKATSAGFRLPLHRAPDFASAVLDVARQVSASAWLAKGPQGA